MYPTHDGSAVSFQSLCDLVHRLGANNTSSSRHVPPRDVFASWLRAVRPSHEDGVRVLRLLFPHEGARRRYGMRETVLARELGAVLGVPRLDRWDAPDQEGGGFGQGGGEGCLGLAVQRAVAQRGVGEARAGRGGGVSDNGQDTRSAAPDDEHAHTRTMSQEFAADLTLEQVDDLLEELSSSSARRTRYYYAVSALASNNTRSSPARTPRAILTALFRPSRTTPPSPYAHAVLVQIILQDLRPLLSPLPRLPVRNPTALLGLTSTSGPPALGLIEALREWDGRAARLFQGGVGDVEACCEMVRRGQGVGPVLGVNVQIPKCIKGRSTASALDVFSGSLRRSGVSSDTVWAETKHDGYRLQIHVAVNGGVSAITIYSKSKRDSTADRINTHSIIAASLGLVIPDTCPTHVLLAQRVRAAPRGAETSTARPAVTSVILEAEVVPYNEGVREGGRGPGEEEFWYLGAAGVSADGWAAGSTRVDSDLSRHLHLVFFDILLLNGQNLLTSSYSARRALLEGTIRPVLGFSSIVRRTPIPLSLGRPTALAALEQAFARSCERREEGLVLKADSAPYPASRSGSAHPWVKLKRDYIPGLGDTVDLVLLGAGWDADRARELRVDTSVLTTFYVGVRIPPRAGAGGAVGRSRGAAPHFEILFCASYGPSRAQLEVYNANVRHGRWASRPFDRDDPAKRRLIGLSWTFHLPRGMPPPALLFDTPLCCEVMGAGFQKRSPASEIYELRWPRLQKIWERDERPWTQALTCPELRQIARQALGYATSPLPPSSPDTRGHGAGTTIPNPMSSPENDSLRALWRNATSLGAVDIADSLPLPSPSPGRRRRPGGSESRLDGAGEDGREDGSGEYNDHGGDGGDGWDGEDGGDGETNGDTGDRATRMTRVASAPDLVDILKTSPPTPRRATRGLRVERVPRVPLSPPARVAQPVHPAQPAQVAPGTGACAGLNGHRDGGVKVGRGADAHLDLAAGAAVRDMLVPPGQSGRDEGESHLFASGQASGWLDDPVPGFGRGWGGDVDAVGYEEEDGNDNGDVLFGCRRSSAPRPRRKRARLADASSPSFGALTLPSGSPEAARSRGTTRGLSPPARAAPLLCSQISPSSSLTSSARPRIPLSPLAPQAQLSRLESPICLPDRLGSFGKKGCRPAVEAPANTTTAPRRLKPLSLRARIGAVLQARQGVAVVVGEGYRARSGARCRVV